MVHDLVRKLSDKKEAAEVLFRAGRNKIFYSDPYVEEMLFPALFPDGKWGYNSNYIKTGMTIK